MFVSSSPQTAPSSFLVGVPYLSFSRTPLHVIARFRRYFSETELLHFLFKFPAKWSLKHPCSLVVSYLADVSGWCSSGKLLERRSLRASVQTARLFRAS